jgi:hypothetical protein
MTRAAAIAVLSAVAMSCGISGRPDVAPALMAELWHEPADLAQRDLLYGPGGVGLVPDAAPPFEQLDADTKGFSPGYDVRDPQGRQWNVKLGPEARTEVVVSRLVWAIGFRQPSIYYVPDWTLSHEGAAARPGPARFRYKDPERPKAGEWSWRDNPFVGTRPLSGLFVLMVMVNNWDLKTSQNAIYRADAEGATRQWFVVKDLGASLGRTNWFFPGKRDDIDAFEREPFIDRVEGNRVRFHYRGAWLEPQLATSVTPSDVVWTCELLARLSESQWMDAFRAGGYSDAAAARYVHRLRQKVDEGLKLRSAAP